MAYPHRFHRLVLAGTLYDDIFNTTVSIAPLAPANNGAATLEVTPELLAAVAGAASNFWGSGGAANVGITGSAILKSIKLNMIGEDGRYVDQSETNEHIYTTPIVGGGVTGHPPQLAVVVTNRTILARGRGSMGRMYLPSCTGFNQLPASGYADVTNAQRVANAVAAFYSALNAVYVTHDGVSADLHRVSVMSNVGAGSSRTVTHVTVGRVVDTMRSRRNKQREQPVEATVTGTAT